MTKLGLPMLIDSTLQV